MNKTGATQQILLVTGMSGAGKSTALQVLEDLGWETLDNFPLRLLANLLDTYGESQMPIAIGLDSRTRGFAPQDIIRECEALGARDEVNLTTLFIDSSDGELQRRYNETRRPHPMARERQVAEGIRDERSLLEPLRNWAEVLIDTSEYSTNQLQQVIRERFGGKDVQGMTITVTSFGFARGMPPLADLLFDMRFLDNPHWIGELRDLTGLDKPVADHIRSDPAFDPAFASICNTLLELLPRYAAQDRSYLNIGFGCTGGRHRSVFSAEAAAQVLREAGFSPTVVHRNLESRPADPFERS
ncbi:MAG: RNase adapter RapZ [Altererythrobacter sp.]|nr:RNase adapter RapZ [Altererythrobacter sp.]